MARSAREFVSLVALAAAMAVSGCTQEAAKPAAEAPAAAPAAPEVHLPIPILNFMRASMEIPSDGIWGVTSSEKLTDEQWLLAEQDAYDLSVAATLLPVGGTGKNDMMWVANDDWKMWAADVQKTAAALRDAVKAKDLMALSMAGDHLAEICEACHTKYRPEKASDGVDRYPFYPVRVMEKK